MWKDDRVMESNKQTNGGEWIGPTFGMQTELMQQPTPPKGGAEGPRGGASATTIICVIRAVLSHIITGSEK